MNLHSSLRPSRAPSRALAGQSQGLRIPWRTPLSPRPGTAAHSSPAGASTQRLHPAPVRLPRHCTPLVFTEARTRPEREPTGSARCPPYSHRCPGPAGQPASGAEVEPRARCPPHLPRGPQRARSTSLSLESAACGVPRGRESQGLASLPQTPDLRVWPPQRPLDWLSCGCLPPEGLMASFSVNSDSPQSPKPTNGGGAGKGWGCPQEGSETQVGLGPGKPPPEAPLGLCSCPHPTMAGAGPSQDWQRLSSDS